MAQHEPREEEFESAEDPAITFHAARRGGVRAEPSVDLSDVLGSAGGSAAREFLGRLSAQQPSTTRYEFQGEIGRGGMGVILKVVDRHLYRPLAMKVILGPGGEARGSTTDEVSEHQLRRFLEEAQITGQLDHPGIVPVHELGLDEKGRTYFTMRLVRGRDLKTLFDRRAQNREVWSISRSLGVVLKICETMAFAHAKGVIHRDLKPANIMVGRFGETYVMDWGLAKVLNREEARQPSADASLVRTELSDTQSEDASKRMPTLDGDVLGTPCYMSPEQARGQQELVSARSDIYSLGAMVYQLLTGQAPYEHPGRRVGAREVLAQLLAGPPTPIHELAPQVPAELVSIVEKAMAREIGDRYPDMLAMADDIQAFLEGRVVSAHATSSWQAFVKLVKRNQAVSISVLCLLLLAAVGTGAFLWQQNQRYVEIQAEQQNTQAARDIALANELVAKRQTYLANIVAADVSLRANEVLEAKRRLEHCPPELRDWEWAHLALAADTSTGRLQLGAAVTCVALDPSGKLLATATENGGLALHDADALVLLHDLVGHTGPVLDLAFSPNGLLLASASADESVRIWDVRLGGAVLHLRQGHEGPVRALAWSAAGDRIASGAEDERVAVWDVASGNLERLLSGHEGSLLGLAFLPGERLLSIADEGTARVFDLATGEESQVHELSAGARGALAVRPDGSEIALAGVDGAIHMWSLKEGVPAFSLAGHGAPVTRLEYLRDGRRLLSASNDGTARLWDPTARQLLATLRGHEDAVLAIGTGSGRLATGSRDGSARVWVPELAENALVLAGGTSHLTDLDVDRDGRRVILSSAYPGAISLCDATSGLELLRVEGFEDELPAIALSPDGSFTVLGHEADATLSVMETRTGELRHGRLEGHLASITALDVSADGGRIASAGMDGRVLLWDAGSGARLLSLGDESSAMLCLRFSPDGDLVAAGGMDGSIRLWSTADGSAVRLLEGHTGAVRSLCFGPGQGELLSGSMDQSLKVWELASGEALRTLTGHAAGVTSADVDPRGRRIVSGSLDGTLRLWEAESGQHLLTLRGHRLPVSSVRFAGGGSRILSASFDDSLRVWETASPAERQEAHRAREAILALRADSPAEAGTGWMEEAVRSLRQRHGSDPALLARAIEILER